MKATTFWLVLSILTATLMTGIPYATAASLLEQKPVLLAKKDTAPTQDNAAAPEKAKYGGVFNYCQTADALFFDEFFGLNWFATTMGQTHDDLLQGDWTKGPAGTGQVSWAQHTLIPLDVATGRLAESWEIPDDTTMIFHIRQGVHFHDKPPTNGREMTADDVVFSLKRLWESPKSYHSKNFPWEKNLVSITAPDRWTVVVKALPGRLGPVHYPVAFYTKIVPREAVEKYGDLGDWRNTVGTGPFMLVDYVSGSSATFVRNPNYWMKDPFRPENRLPYLDGVKYLIIPDVSTRMAALRTGKLDHIGGLTAPVGWEDAAGLMKTNPELKYLEWVTTSAPSIYMRLDTPPFTDIRVRQALMMAVDNRQLLDTYYGGRGVILGAPVAPISDLKDIYIPLEELPESTRKLYEYHPDRAKQLLAEAGYPNGFKTEVLCTSTAVDLLSIVKAFWAEIGVDLTLDVKEYAVYTSQRNSWKHSQMVYGGQNNCNSFRFLDWTPGNWMNSSMVDDPKVNEARVGVEQNWFDWDKKCRIYRNILPHMYEQCIMITLPTSYSYTFWQPWVRNYHGEYEVGYEGAFHDFTRFLWLDEKLQKK